MSAAATEPEDPFPYPVIHVDGDAAIVPLAELRVLRALKEQATPEAIRAAEEAAELAEGAEVRARHDEWIAAGRPGAIPHEEFRRVLLGGTAG
jgi:hypothetical protein